MIEIKNYWIDDTPTIEDVKEAFELVHNNDIVVKLNWHFPWSGNYNRVVTKNTLEKHTPESYFKDVIPHCYGV